MPEDNVVNNNVSTDAPFVGTPNLAGPGYSVTAVPAVSDAVIMGNYTHNGPPVDTIPMISLEEFVTLAETFKALEQTRVQLVEILDKVRQADPGDLHFTIGSAAIPTEKGFVVNMYEAMLKQATGHVEDYRSRIAQHNVKV
jgi:hypothetical protein